MMPPAASAIEGDRRQHAGQQQAALVQLAAAVASPVRVSGAVIVTVSHACS